MAEALAVIGSIASIVQLLEFGGKVLGRLKEFHSKRVEIPQCFRHIEIELPVLLDALAQTKTAIETGSVSAETEDALLPAIKACRRLVRKLHSILARLVTLKSDSWSRKTRKTFSSLRHEGKVQDIRTEIDRYIRVLTYSHAATTLAFRSRAEHPQSRPTPCSTVPFRQDPDFVARDVLTQAREKLSVPAARVAFVGLGGVGKSQLAIECSYQVRQEAADTWVFWVHCGTTARFEEGYREIAEAVKIPERNKPGANILQLVSRWLHNDSNGRWLMILDNADDPNVFFSQRPENQSARATQSLHDFLPQSDNGSILITSRNQDVALKLTGRHHDIIKVEPLDERHAITLLSKKLPDNLDMDGAKELVDALDYMPLAIAQAAAYISQRLPRISIRRYLHKLSTSDEERERLLGTNLPDIRRDETSSNSIMATWQVSFSYLRESSPSAARLLSLMSLFDRQGIPESLLRGNYKARKERLSRNHRHRKRLPDSQASENHQNHTHNKKKAHFEDDITTLRSYSLITTDTNGQKFEMHRLVQISMKKWLEINDELKRWEENYIKILRAAVPYASFDNWGTWQELFPHAQMVLSYRPKNERYLEKWSWILQEAGRYCRDRGNPNIGEAMLEQALQAWEICQGEEGVDTLNCTGHLADTYFEQGRWEEAGELQKATLEATRRILGPGHRDTLSCINDLAWTYKCQRKLEEAKELCELGLELTKDTLCPDDNEILRCMGCLAGIYQDQGRLKEAEVLELRVLETRRENLGPEHMYTLTSMLNLASTYADQERWKEAEELEGWVLETMRGVLGREHPDTLNAMNNHAHTWQAQGRWQQAIELMSECVILQQKVLGVDHPNTINSCQNLEVWKAETEEAFREGKDSKVEAGSVEESVQDAP
ncbi:related to kinesin light chain [Phialocephala subalpina]|uniref:Related to kinesin light chain n=1 Tax=Phialocephala subalpina TaxID=576137 RepID=A0A1L7XNH8_9HELO|nr:related to kinesin light chain [Phialocephala subalpina]